MSDEPIQQLKDKLNKALRNKAVLTERSKLLGQQVDDLRRRDEQSTHLMGELIERQRELNFMLHRTNSVFQRMQEANLALSTEFTELVKELPAPESPDWEQRVAKINDLFKMTGELADEVESDVFRSKPQHDRPAERPEAPVAQQPVATQETVQVIEPVHVTQLEPEPEPERIEPEITAATFTVLEDTPIEEPECEPVEAVQEPEPEINIAQPEDAERIEREEKLNRLFSAMNESNEPTASDSPVDNDSKPGAFIRIWQKFKKRQPSADIEETTSQSSDRSVNSADTTLHTGVRQASQQPVSDLWDESSDFEVEIIPAHDNNSDTTPSGEDDTPWNEMKSAS